MKNVFSRKSVSRILAVFVLCCAFSGAFADSWFVCLSSFRSKDNALECMKELYQNGYEVCLDEHKSAESVFYRVLLYEPFESANGARVRKDVLCDDEKIQQLGIFDLWICQGKPSLTVVRKLEAELPEADVKESEANDSVVPEIREAEVSFLEESSVLRANDEALSVSENLPYSVVVRKYKEEQKAEYDKNRLAQKDIESFILKTYDDGTFFSFDLNAGAFETEEEAEEFQKELEGKGIYNTQISDFRDLNGELEKYDEIIESNTVTNENYFADFPEVFTENINSLLDCIPAHEDFQVEKITICDLINLSYTDMNPAVVGLTGKYDYVHDAADSEVFVHYKDDLFESEIGFFMAKTEDSVFDDVPFKFNGLSEIDESDLKRFQIETAAGIFDCRFVEKKAGDVEGASFYDDSFDAEEPVLCLDGITQDGKIYINLTGIKCSKEQLIDFVSKTGSSSIMVYPQVRKNLSLFPQKMIDEESSEILKVKIRDFLIFSLYKVPESYTIDRNYSQWSMPIVGHWESEFSILENEEMFTVDFFDLDYDYSADKVHKMFVDSHEEEGENAHSLQLNGLDAWYQKTDFTKELSFSKKSFIISVDANPKSEWNEEELMEIAEDLQIWN